MKYILLSACLLFAVQVSAQHNNDTVSKSPSKIYTYVEKMPAPSFDLRKYLQENLHYPEKARRNNIEGRVIVKFVVTETGDIDKVAVIKGIGGGCDEEAK